METLALAPFPADVLEFLFVFLDKSIAELFFDTDAEPVLMAEVDVNVDVGFDVEGFEEDPFLSMDFMSSRNNCRTCARRMAALLVVKGPK